MSSKLSGANRIKGTEKNIWSVKLILNFAFFKKRTHHLWILKIVCFYDRVEFGKLAVENKALNLGQVMTG